jgi:hypothetical protein
MDLNLKRFLAYYGKIILMPEILMSVYRCTNMYSVDTNNQLLKVEYR